MTQQSCANFTLQRIGWDGDDGGYDADGTNYQCTCCGKQFQKLHALMQHQTNKATCMQFYNSSGSHVPQLGYAEDQHNGYRYSLDDSY